MGIGSLDVSFSLQRCLLPPTALNLFYCKLYCVATSVSLEWCRSHFPDTGAVTSGWAIESDYPSVRGSRPIAWKVKVVCVALIHTGRCPVGRRPTGVAHSKIARVARVVFVLYCVWMDVLPSLQFLTVTKCTETTVPSEPLYRTILNLPLPLYPLTLYPYPYRHERKSGCNVVLNGKKYFLPVF